MLYPIRIPAVYRWLHNDYFYRGESAEKTIHLSFDDGPIPEVTPWVLQKLKEYNAKATFFCIGNNVEKHPLLFQEIKNAGHSIGNHAYTHRRNDYKNHEAFMVDIEKCQSLVESKLFRPPHGNLTKKQGNLLCKTYKVVLWDVLSWDFSPKVNKEQCLKNVLSKTRNGSVIVFHDSIKAEEKMKFALEGTLKHFSNLGYTFTAILPTSE